MAANIALQRFRAAKTAEEEKCLLAEAIPKNTAYNTKWACKVFEEWQSTRLNKIAMKETTGLEGVVLASVEDLSVPVHEMTKYSLNFWLCKFVTEVAKRNGERYPPKSLYLLICGINRHLLEVKKDNGVSILAKGDRRLVVCIGCVVNFVLAAIGSFE